MIVQQLSETLLGILTFDFWISRLKIFKNGNVQMFFGALTKFWCQIYILYSGQGLLILRIGPNPKECWILIKNEVIKFFVATGDNKQHIKFQIYIIFKEYGRLNNLKCKESDVFVGTCSSKHQILVSNSCVSQDRDSCGPNPKDCWSLIKNGGDKNVFVGTSSGKHF